MFPTIVTYNSLYYMDEFTIAASKWNNGKCMNERIEQHSIETEILHN